MLKRTILLAAVAGMVLAMAPAAQADTITLVKVEPHRGGGWNVVSDGTLSTVDAGFPTSGRSTMNTGVYAQSLTGLTINGTPGIDLTWGLRITASAGHGVKIDSEPWVVDNPADSTNFNYLGRINAGETLTFAVENIVVTAGYVATFDGFSDFNLISGTGGVWTPVGLTGVVSHNGTGSNFRVDGADFGFTVVPEPATLALLGLGGLGLILGRKRR